MSDQGKARGGSPGPALPRDDFVARLVKDPAAPPRTRLLSGYLGASNEEGHTRIYFDPELSGYADVPNGDILHTERSGEGPLARTLVWVRADAQALHGPAGGTRQRAGFFEGRVWNENQADTVAVGTDTVNADTVRFGAAGAASLAFPCGPSIAFPCGPSVARPCGPSALVPCGPSVVVRCPPSVVVRCPPSVVVRCPPSVVVRCPQSVAVACPPSLVPPCVAATVRCPSAVDACPTRFCPPGGFPRQPFGAEGSGGGADTVLFGSGGGTDTVFFGSGGGTDTVFYGSGGGADTVYYGAAGGMDNTARFGQTIQPTQAPAGCGPTPQPTQSCPVPRTAWCGGGADAVFSGSDTAMCGPTIQPTQAPACAIVTPRCPSVLCPRPPTPWVRATSGCPSGWCPSRFCVQPPELEGPTASYACPPVR